jgi:transposase
MSLTYCPECLKKQQRINELEEELAAAKSRLRYQERTAAEGPFGSSTPSSKVPIKPSALPERQARRGGAKGRGRMDGGAWPRPRPTASFRRRRPRGAPSAAGC